MDTLGDWSWPGTRPAAEILPPPWVPTHPPRADAGGAAALAATPQRAPLARLVLAALASAMLALGATVAVEGPVPLERLVGYGGSSAPPAARFASASSAPAIPLPTLTEVSSDAAGSSIDHASYASPALSTTGSFYVYLPPGFAATAERYPVLYLLHGNSQPASAFLQIGLQGELDHLISTHQIRPLIAVMIQGGPGSNNWRNQGKRGYESYVLEVQQLTDRLLPTIATRSARGIAGDSMGGYGAMNIALGNPYRFSLAESWLGFFNGLGPELRAARPVISRLGLRAFAYGGEADKIADPEENAPFAAQLRAAGASAHSAVYAGEHSLETIEAHLGSQLLYAGRGLAAAIAAEARAAKAAQVATGAGSAGTGVSRGTRAARPPA
jgi:S-formylglutathione hydrolase FrmB